MSWYQTTRSCKPWLWTLICIAGLLLNVVMARCLTYVDRSRLDATSPSGRLLEYWIWAIALLVSGKWLLLAINIFNRLVLMPLPEESERIVGEHTPLLDLVLGMHEGSEDEINQVNQMNHTDLGCFKTALVLATQFVDSLVCMHGLMLFLILPVYFCVASGWWSGSENTMDQPIPILATANWSTWSYLSVGLIEFIECNTWLMLYLNKLVPERQELLDPSSFTVQE